MLSRAKNTERSIELRGVSMNFFTPHLAQFSKIFVSIVQVLCIFVSSSIKMVWICNDDIYTRTCIYSVPMIILHFSYCFTFFSASELNSVICIYDCLDEISHHLLRIYISIYSVGNSQTLEYQKNLKPILNCSRLYCSNGSI